MAADSDGVTSACGGGGGVAVGGKGGSCGVVVTCEGDLRDPRFPARLRRLLRELRALLAEPHPHTLKVNKVEPWNSVRVTLSVPRAAAARLRALAAAGAPQLRALGILSVQLDGDAVVSLRLQHGTEVRINTDNSAPDDASTSRSQPASELLAGLGGIGRLLEGEAPAEPQPGPSPRDNFKSPNTVCPMDGKIPQNIVPHAAERCEFPFGSMTQARVIHRKENTLGLTGGCSGSRAPADGVFARPSTSSFPGPPPPYPAAPPPAPQPPQSPHSPAVQSPAPPTVAMSSPLLVNLLQNDAPAPQPRAKPPHPAKLDRLEDGQVELAVGRAPFEYRARPPPRAPLSPAPPPPPSPRPGARLTPYIRRTFPARPAPPVQYRSPAPNATVVGRRFPYPPVQEGFAPPPPPYRQARPRGPVTQPARVTHEDLQALLPPTTTMDQKTQSSFQEFQRYQQQYNARQRAASRGGTSEWSEPYRDLGLTLSDLPDSCDLDQLLPTLGADLDLDDISDLDGTKLDFYDQPSTSDAPDQVLREIAGAQYQQTNGPYEPTQGPSTQTPADVPSKRESFDESTFMPPPPVPPHPKYAPASPVVANTPNAPFKSPPIAGYSSPSSVPKSPVNSSMGVTTNVNTSINSVNTTANVNSKSMSGNVNAHSNMGVKSSMSGVNTSIGGHHSTMSGVNLSMGGINTNMSVDNSTMSNSNMNSMPTTSQPVTAMTQSSMPPPSKVPMRGNPSVSTATVGSQATQQEIEEQSKQYLIKTLMRDDDVIPPTPPKEEKKPEELTVANCTANLEENVANAIKEVAKESSPTTPMPEIFGIAKSIPEEDIKREDDMLKNKLAKKDDKSAAQKGGKPRTTGVKEKPTMLKDRIVRDGKSVKAASPRGPPRSPALGEPAEKESIKLRLKLDKNEPVVQPVYKADVSFVNQQKGEKPTEGELRVPPLHISLRGRNSAVIKNSKKEKEKKKFNPGDVHSKKFKIRKTLETEDNKVHRRESSESVPSKSGENETDEYLNAKDSTGLDFHYEGDTINEITGDNNVVYRMKTISKNAHIVTKHDYKLNNRVGLDLIKKKKLKILSDGKSEKERDREWRNDTLDKEGKYAQNEGYRETLNNHDVKLKLPASKVDNGATCDNNTEGVVQSDGDSETCGASESVDSRLLKCKALDWTMDSTPELRNSDTDNNVKRTITESAITSPNGLLATEKKRKNSHSSCPDPPVVVGSTNVGTIGRAESPPGNACAARTGAGGVSPRRKDRPKDKSYCKLVAERAAEFGARSPQASAQGEDSGIESMDALSEKSPNQASQSPPGPARKERLELARSTSPASVQRIIGVSGAPASDELLERLARGPPPRYEHEPHHHLDHLGDIEAELAKMHEEHARRAPTPILRSPAPPADPPPARRDPPRHTYPGPATEPAPALDPVERLPMKADFPDKSLLEQLLIEIPTPDYTKRTESPSPSALERVARSSVRTRSSSKMNSPAEPAPRTPRLSPAGKAEASPRAAPAPAPPAAPPPTAPAPAHASNKPAPAAKRKRRESESSCASTVSCEDGASPARPLKKKPRWVDGARPAQPQPNLTKGKKDSDSDSDEPLICKVRGKAKGVRGAAVVAVAVSPAAPAAAATAPAAASPAGGKAAKGEGVGTRRSVRHGAVPPPPPPPNNNTPVRRKTRSAVGEGGGTTAGAVRRRRASRDGK